MTLVSSCFPLLESVLPGLVKFGDDASDLLYPLLPALALHAVDELVLERCIVGEIEGNEAVDEHPAIDIFEEVFLLDKLEN